MIAAFRAGRDHGRPCHASPRAAWPAPDEARSSTDTQSRDLDAVAGFKLSLLSFKRRGASRRCRCERIHPTIKIRKGRKSRKPRKTCHGEVKETLKETHFLPFFCACCHPTNCQGREAKICGVSGSGDESFATKRGTKCTQKRPCPEMRGFCNFAVFVDEKSRAPEHVKRDPLFSVFLCFFAILDIVKDVRRKTVGFHVRAMNLSCQNAVQNARKRAVSRNAWVL